MDQSGGSGPRTFMLRIRKASLERPGRALAPNRGAAGLLALGVAGPAGLTSTMMPGTGSRRLTLSIKG